MTELGHQDICAAANRAKAPLCSHLADSQSSLRLRNALTDKDIDPVDEFGYIHKNGSPPPTSFELSTGKPRKSLD